MIGIVVVSHSSRLAEGVVELAREMGGAEVAVEAAGGLGLPPASEALGNRRPEVAERTGGATLGTSATEVLAAIERAWSDDGVLVLMDLGSAVLSSETALDLLGPGGQLLRTSPAARADVDWGREFLWSRAGTIYSGSSEVQRNIIAKRVLNLPQDAR